MSLVSPRTRPLIAMLWIIATLWISAFATAFVKTDTFAYFLATVFSYILFVGMNIVEAVKFGVNDPKKT